MGRKNKRTRRPKHRGSHLKPNPNKQRHVWQPPELWEKEKSRLTEEAEWGMNGKYDSKADADSEAKKGLIISALALWRFVRDFFRWQTDYYESHDGKVVPRLVDRRDPAGFLESFLDDPNPYVRLVAKVESLPTPVWRKLLWKHNIDFMSFESFLRRLKPEQWQALEDNCDDWLSGQVPQAYGRLERKLKGITVERLGQDESSAYCRYQSKQAWSHDLFGVGFGFEKYADESNDETAVAERGKYALYAHFLRDLFSRADSQMVVDPGGIYSWFHHKPRSNFLWNRGREVVHGPKFCPDWWKTVLAHLWFWLFSPAMAAKCSVDFMAAGWAAHHWTAWLLCGLTASLMPLWLVLSALKLVLLGIDGLIGHACDKLLASERAQRFGGWLGQSVKKAANNKKLHLFFYVLLISMTCYGLYRVVSAVHLWLSRGFGRTDAAIVMLAAGAYFGWKAYGNYKQGSTPCFTNYPWPLKLPLSFFAATVVWRGLTEYAWLLKRIADDMAELLIWLSGWAWSAIKMASGAIISFLAASGPAWLALLLPAALLLGLFYATTLSEDRREKLERGLLRLCKATGLILAAGLICILAKEPLLAVPLAVALLGLAAVSRSVHRSIPSVARVGQTAATFQERLLLLERINCPSDALRRSQLLMTAGSDEERIAIVSRFVKAMRYYDYSSSEIEALCQLFLPGLTLDFLEYIEAQRDYLGLCYNDKKGLARILEVGFEKKIGFREAHDIFREERRAARLRREKRIKLIKRVLIIPVIWSAAAAMCRKAFDLSATTYLFLKRLLTESCPYVARSKTLY